jgi:DNA-binding transcriptional ArsR family regulator
MHPFQAMAQPARRRIVEILSSGEHTAGQVAEVVGSEFRISRTAVSKHLRVLRDAGLVDCRADVQWRWYRLTSAGLEHLEADVNDLREKFRRRVGWDPETLRDHDPLDAPPPWAMSVPFKGPGRPYSAGTRGRQAEPPPWASEPDLGLYPTRTW